MGRVSPFVAVGAAVGVAAGAYYGATVGHIDAAERAELRQDVRVAEAGYFDLAGENQCWHDTFRLILDESLASDDPNETYDADAFRQRLTDRCGEDGADMAQAAADQLVTVEETHQSAEQNSALWAEMVSHGAVGGVGGIVVGGLAEVAYMGVRGRLRFE